MNTPKNSGFSLLDRSKIFDKLHNQEPPHGEAQYIEYTFADGYTLEARALLNSHRDWPNLIALHGATGDFSRANPIFYRLQASGISSLAPNLSGHSVAGLIGQFTSNIARNIEEADAFYGQLADGPKIVAGSSMGGTDALELLRRHPDEIEKLILFYPAIYDPAAYDLPFGSAELKAKLNEPYSWRRTTALEPLREFTGKTLLIIGEFDGLNPVDYGLPETGSVGTITIDGVEHYSPIPADVIAMVEDAAQNITKIVLPGSDHRVPKWAQNHPTEADELCQTIADFIKS